MIQIPVTTNGNSDFDITIEGVTYTIQYRFNTRNTRIYMSLLLGTQELIMGMRLLELDITNGVYTNPDAPSGFFFVTPLEETDQIATLGNLGINKPYSIIYATRDEMIEEGFI